MRILERALELWFFLANIDDHGRLQSQNPGIKQALGSTVHNSYLDFNEAGLGWGDKIPKIFTSFLNISELSEHSEASVTFLEWRIWFLLTWN